jgi:CSLREA domain-containing protein
MLQAGSASAGAAVFTVTTTTDEAAVGSLADGVCDSLPGTGERCSLRAAIQEANAQAATDTVVVPDLGGDYDLTLGGTGEDAAASGDLDVTAGLAIRGEGEPVVDGMLADRVLHAGPGASSPAVIVTGIELRRGGAVARGAGILVDGGALTLDRVTVADGRATDAGQAEGGGIALDGGAHSITASTLAGNRADGQTGAFGGGVRVGPSTSLTVLNSTISGNVAEGEAGPALGGGIFSSGSVALTHVTVDGNEVVGLDDARGGSVYALGGVVALRATVISEGSGESGAGNCASAGASFVSQGSNLEAPAGSGSECGLSGAAGDRFASSAALAPLAPRGGPTLTHALFSHSPALEAIPSCFPVTSDQRGEPRPGGAACEIGSFERQEQPPAGATCFGRRPTIIGRRGVEQVVGTPAADVILGSGGSEAIAGLGGKDLVCAGKGKDRVKGGPSRDQIAGEGGADTLLGQDGKDELRGGSAPDVLDGGPGRDFLDGGGGRDSCRRSSADKLRGC